MDRIGDFFSDLRSPIHYAKMEQLHANRAAAIRSMPRQKDIYFCITIDIEKDYGSLSNDLKAPTVIEFLHDAKDRLDKIGKGCLFVQGSLLRSNADALKEFTAAGFDIGLHGYYHELWGQTQWYLRDRPQPIQRKKELLEKAKRESEELGLEMVSFRAPNMVIDDETLSLVAQSFRYDSSQSVHRGESPLPMTVNGLRRIPVSVNPLPPTDMKFGLKFHRFEVFNLSNLLWMDRARLIDYVDNVTRYQAANNIKPHLVFLCHSWEFSNVASIDPKISYSSVKNYEKVKAGYDIIRDEFGCTVVNFQELCDFISIS